MDGMKEEVERMIREWRMEIEKEKKEMMDLKRTIEDASKELDEREDLISKEWIAIELERALINEAKAKLEKSSKQLNNAFLLLKKSQQQQQSREERNRGNIMQESNAESLSNNQ